ncbi:hypothetical protein V7S43_007264 [Phytophthora oleae]|uniref:HTH CENPB-type domain-containing protein n=1 Tax=Phytophthora oleae TaxID=2107226 RepID=A0ABD3FN12_9STRA
MDSYSGGQAARVTLTGWRDKYSDATLSTIKDPRDCQGRSREKGGGRKRKMEEFELDAIGYLDERLSEGVNVTHALMLQHSRTKYPAFGLKEGKAQRSWIVRFLKRYKPSPTTDPIDTPPRLPTIPDSSIAPQSSDASVAGQQKEATAVTASSTTAGSTLTCEKGRYQQTDSTPNVYRSQNTNLSWIEDTRGSLLASHLPSPSLQHPLAAWSLRSGGSPRS